MGIISNEIIAQIRERTDIIQVIGEHVRLNPSGNSYKALCPFHKEKTPSFHVIPKTDLPLLWLRQGRGCVLLSDGA